MSCFYEKEKRKRNISAQRKITKAIAVLDKENYILYKTVQGYYEHCRQSEYEETMGVFVEVIRFL